MSIALVTPFSKVKSLGNWEVPRSIDPLIALPTTGLVVDGLVDIALDPVYTVIDWSSGVKYTYTYYPTYIQVGSNITVPAANHLSRAEFNPDTGEFSLNVSTFTLEVNGSAVILQGYNMTATDVGVRFIDRTRFGGSYEVDFSAMPVALLYVSESVVSRVIGQFTQTDPNTIVSTDITINNGQFAAVDRPDPSINTYKHHTSMEINTDDTFTSIAHTTLANSTYSRFNAYTEYVGSGGGLPSQATITHVSTAATDLLALTALQAQPPTAPISGYDLGGGLLADVVIENLPSRRLPANMVSNPRYMDYDGLGYKLYTDAYVSVYEPTDITGTSFVIAPPVRVGWIQTSKGDSPSHYLVYRFNSKNYILKGGTLTGTEYWRLFGKAPLAYPDLPAPA